MVILLTVALCVLLVYYCIVILVRYYIVGVGNRFAWSRIPVPTDEKLDDRHQPCEPDKLDCSLCTVDLDEDCRKLLTFAKRQMDEIAANEYRTETGSTLPDLENQEIPVKKSLVEHGNPTTIVTDSNRCSQSSDRSTQAETATALSTATILQNIVVDALPESGLKGVIEIKCATSPVTTISLVDIV